MLLTVLICAADLRIVAIDFCGHGHSSHRATVSPLSLPQYLAVRNCSMLFCHNRYSALLLLFLLLQEVDDCVHALKWDKFILLGHSMGGVVAVLYSAMRPRAVQKLICIDSLGPNSAEAAAAPGKIFFIYANIYLIQH